MPTAGVATAPVVKRSWMSWLFHYVRLALRPPNGRRFNERPNTAHEAFGPVKPPALAMT